jgi:hypothetical protein
MRSKKSLAVFAALMMLTVCIIPIAGFGNSSFEGTGSFMEKPNSVDKVPDDYIGIFDLDDLKQVGSGFTDGTVTWGLDAKYILMNDLDFTKDNTDLNDGAEIEVVIVTSGSSSLMKTTITVKKDGATVGDFTVWANANYGVAAEDNAAILTGNTITMAFIEADDFIIMVDASSAKTIKKSANGNFDPIGSISDPFTGTFNGNGHVIKGMETTYAGTSAVADSFIDVGMFAVIDGPSAVVEKLGMVGGYSASSSKGDLSSAGIITGWLKDGEIKNCYSTGNVYSSAANPPSAFNAGTYAGGIAGVAEDTVKTSYNTGTVISRGSEAFAGGITGFLGTNDLTTFKVAELKGCYNTGSIFAKGDDYAAAGGIVGKVPKDIIESTPSKVNGKLEMNRNLGAIRAEVTSETGNAFAGGIVGHSSIEVSASYSWFISSMSTTVIEAIVKKGTAYAGGIAGYTDAGVTYSYLYTNSSSARVRATATTGDAGGDSWAGGIAGYATYIYNCYNRANSDTTSNVATTGNVANDKNSGRIVGYMPEDSPLMNVYFRASATATLKDLGGGDRDGEYSIDGIEPGEDSIRTRGASGAIANDMMLDNNSYFNEPTDLYDGSGPVKGWFESTVWAMTSSKTSSSAPNNGYPFIDGMPPGTIFIVDRSWDTTIVKGQEGGVTLFVVAQSELGLTYRWQQSTSGTGSWSDVSDERASPTVNVTPTSTMFYQCVVSNSTNGGSSSWNETVGNMKVTVLPETIDIRTPADLLKILSNMDGSYIQRADLDFTDVDLNAGDKLHLDFDTDTVGYLGLRVTFNNNSPAPNMTVYFDGEFGTTDSDGKVSFPYDVSKDYKITVGGVTPSGEALATYDFEAGKYERITKNSNGNMNPIGTFTNPFVGTYNGNGFKIIGLDIINFSDSVDAVAGLFGVADKSAAGKKAVIKNVTLEDGSVSSMSSTGTAGGSAYAGSVLGYSLDASVERCSSNLTVTAFGYSAGTGNAAAGGMVGSNTNTVTSNSSGDVSAFAKNASYVGGIAGVNLNAISESYSTGKLSGVSIHSDVYTGGIAGESEGDITNCYSLCEVEGSKVGGIIGNAIDGTVTNCYFLTGKGAAGIAYDVTALLIDGDAGRIGVTASGAKTETQLKNKATFFQETTVVNGEDVGGWNFSGDVWYIDGGFPGLKAPKTIAEPSGDGGFDMKYVAIIVIAIIVVLLALVLLRRRSA